MIIGQYFLWAIRASVYVHCEQISIGTDISMLKDMTGTVAEMEDRNAGEMAGQQYFPQPPLSPSSPS
jgi:hypothetical protein